MKKNDLSNLKCVWAALFILGVIMLNFPFLQTFNKDIKIFGIPLILLYFITGWPIAIGIIYLYSKEFIKQLK